MDYRKVAEEIYEKVGKKENIISAAHCATRLRLVLADNAKCDDKAVEEIENISGGSLRMEFEYDNINTFLAGQMTVGIDDTMSQYIQKIEKSRSAKQLEARKKRTKPAEE